MSLCFSATAAIAAVTAANSAQGTDCVSDYIKVSQKSAHYVIALNGATIALSITI